MQDGLRQACSQDVAFAAHSLKSSSAVIGAEPLAEICRALEEAAKSRSIEGIPAMMVDAVAMHEQVCELLKIRYRECLS